MSKDRKVFDELMSGVDAMRNQRERKIILRTYEEEEIAHPMNVPAHIRIKSSKGVVQTPKAEDKTQ